MAEDCHVPSFDAITQKPRPWTAVGCSTLQGSRSGAGQRDAPRQSFYSTRVSHQRSSSDGKCLAEPWHWAPAQRVQQGLLVQQWLMPCRKAQGLAETTLFSPSKNNCKPGSQARQGSA